MKGWGINWEIRVLAPGLQSYRCRAFNSVCMGLSFTQIYLKEILRDIGIYNVKGTHKNTWELKPEYRHYQNEEKSD